jgi:hypothetical protein
MPHCNKHLTYQIGCLDCIRAKSFSDVTPSYNSDDDSGTNVFNSSFFNDDSSNTPSNDYTTPDTSSNDSFLASVVAIRVVAEHRETGNGIQHIP